MGVQESLNQVIAELANRRIQLKDTGDPNLDVSLDGALIGTTVLQTDSGPPMVTWRKNRAGANGWDLELLSPQPYPYTIYVNANNTSPVQDGSVTNPFVTIQDALDFMGSPPTLDDYAIQRTVYVSEGVYAESPVIPAARSVTILLEGTTLIDGYVTITVDQALLPSPANSCVVSICGMTLATRGPSWVAVRPGLNGIQHNVITPYQYFYLQVYGANVWEMIDASINPTSANEKNFIIMESGYMRGKDIGGGVWKSIYAPYSCMHQLTDVTLESELDVYSYLSIKDSTLWDFRIRNRWLPYWASGTVGIINSYITGTITTPVSSTVKCLPCDLFSMRLLDLYLRYGYVTVNLAHIFEFHDMWCNEITVNTGSTVVLDSFPIGSGSSCVWQVNIYRGTTQFRRSQIGAVWTSAGSINSQGEIKFGDIGDTSSITLAVDVSGGTTVRLTATTTVTSTWKVRVLRNITHAYNAL